MSLPDVSAAIEQTLLHIAQPGSWWTGVERVDLARVARDALAGVEWPPNSLPDTAVEAAQAVAEAPDYITPDWIDDLERRGLARPAYVEIIGIVARISAVDTYAHGAGVEPFDLHHPHDGEPSRHVPDGLVETAWVPTVGQPGAPNALTVVPGEHHAQEELHTALYLGYGEMADLDATKDGLHRTEMELVAARTSYLNNCFY